MKLACMMYGLTAIIMLPHFIRTASDDGAIVAVAVEEENDTSVDVLVNSVKGTTESFADPDAEPFIPTKDWKTVKPGQSIPAGLHVRLNLQTGEREAKLMDGDDGSKYTKLQDVNIIGSTSRLQYLKKVFEEAIKETESNSADENLKYWKQDGKQGIINTKGKSFSRDELKDALKKFKASSDDVKIKQEKQHFRTADQLKQELKDLDLNFKTDTEILSELIAKYNNESTSTDEKLSVLEEFELLVHQIDNAQYLVDSGALEFIIKDLNHTDIRICQEAAFVLGSAVQSNPQVQVAAMKAGVMPHLIQKLTLSSDTQVQNRYLYALATLIRHFPYAQQKLVESGGLQTLTSLVARSHDVKTKVRIVTLITDIISERKFAEEQLKVKEDKILREKVNQYQQVELLTQLKEHHFCDMIPPLLSLEEHDTREKILIAMETLFRDCTEEFHQSHAELHKLEEEYATKAKEEEMAGDTDTYFRDFLEKIKSILSQIESHEKKLKHVEL